MGLPSAGNLAGNPRRRDRWLNILLASSFILASVPFGTVHPGWRALAGGIAGLLGLAVLLTTRHLPVPSRSRMWIGAGATAAVLLAGLAFLPVTAGMRVLLQPAVAGPVNQVLALAGDGTAPLALDPWNGLVEWGLTVGLVLLAGGFAETFRSPRRARRTAVILVASGVLLVVVGWLHHFTGAQAIWWTSGVPAQASEPFFAPFVSPNHAGAALAFLLPLGFALVFRARSSLTAGLAVLAVLTLAGGVWTSGSRGAVLAAVAGLGVMVLLWGAPRWRVLVVGFSVALTAVVLAFGPDRIGLAFTAIVSPRTHSIVTHGYSDLLSGRLLVYRDTLDLLGGSLLVGVGPGGFDDGLRVVKTSPTFGTWWHAHQEVLQVAAEHGLLVLGLWAAVVVALAVRGVRRIRRDDRPDVRLFMAAWLASGASIAVFSLYDFPLRIGALAVLTALVAGALLGLGADLEPSAGPRARRWLRAQVAVLAVVLGVAQGLVLLGALGDGWGVARAEVAVARGDEAVDAARAGDGDWETAAGWYQEALRRQPIQRLALQKLARVRQVQGRTQEAEAVLRAGTDVEPTIPWVWRDLARLQRRQGDEAGAEASWRRALWCDLPPEEGLADALVTEALLGPGDPEAKAERVLPDRPDRLTTAAALLARMAYVEEAERLYRRAADTGDPMARLHLADFLVRHGRPEEALPITDGLPDRCWGRVIEADAQMALGRPAEAILAYEGAFAVCGNHHPGIRRSLALARLASRDERGVRMTEGLLQTSPRDHALRRALLQWYRDAMQRSGVVEQLDQLVEHGGATAAEQAELERLRLGGPLTPGERDDGPAPTGPPPRPGVPPPREAAGSSG